jgi:hypothetical protein
MATLIANYVYRMSIKTALTGFGAPHNIELCEASGSIRIVIE